MGLRLLDTAGLGLRNIHTAKSNVSKTALALKLVLNAQPNF